MNYVWKPALRQHKLSWFFYFHLHSSMEFTCVGIGGRCYVVHKRQREKI